MQKKLYKSRNDRKLSGVCAGIAEYFDIDSTLVRLAWILLTIFSAGFGGLIAYIVAAMVMPENNGSNNNNYNNGNNNYNNDYNNNDNNNNNM